MNPEKLQQIHEAAKQQAEVPTIYKIGELVSDALSSQTSPVMQRPAGPLSDHWVSMIHVPERHAHRKEFQGDRWKATGRLLADRLGTGFLSVLLGRRSCGKTQLGVQLIRTALRHNHQGLFCKSFELFITMRNAHNERADAFMGALGRYLTDPLLVIDQFEMRTLSQFDYEMLCYFLDKRYEAVRDTLICSNHTETGFADNVDRSILERIKETGEIIICDWEKFR